MPTMEICERARHIWVCESKTKRGQEGERSQTTHKQNTNETQTKIKKKKPIKDREVDEIEDKKKEHVKTLKRL